MRICDLKLPSGVGASFRHFWDAGLIVEHLAIAPDAESRAERRFDGLNAVFNWRNAKISGPVDRM